MPATGDDDVLGPALVQLLGKGQALLGGLGTRIEDAADLVVVGLDEEGPGVERLEQERTGRVDDEADAAAPEAPDDDVVHVLRQRLGDGSRQDERVALADVVDALEELVDLLLADAGAHAVDHGHDDAVELHVDAREAMVQANEVGRDAALLERLDEIVAREACDNAKGHVHHLELVQQRGDVNAVAAAVQLFARGPVGEAHVERERMHDVIDGGVQRDGIYQRKLLPKTP